MIIWAYRGRGGAEHERVVLGDDGAVSRLVAVPGGDAQIGWWSGALDGPGAASEMAAGLATAASAASARRVASRPPAAGAWSAQVGDRLVGLWHIPADDGPMSEVRARLRELLADAQAAAATAVRVCRFEAAWVTVRQDRSPSLTLESRGEEPIELMFADTADPPVALVTDAAEVVGYFGQRFALSPGDRVTGFLRGRRPAKGALSLEGEAYGGDEALAFRVTLPLPEG